VFNAMKEKAKEAFERITVKPKEYEFSGKDRK